MDVVAFCSLEGTSGYVHCPFLTTMEEDAIIFWNIITRKKTDDECTYGEVINLIYGEESGWGGYPAISLPKGRFEK